MAVLSLVSFVPSKCSLISHLDFLAVEQCFGNKWQRCDWLIFKKNNRALIGQFRGSTFYVFNFESQLPGCRTFFLTANLIENKCKYLYINAIIMSLIENESFQSRD